MMLNTDMGMVFDQNKPLADCLAEGKASSPKGKSGRTERKKARKACRKELAGRKSRDLPGVLAQNGECCAWITDKSLYF